MPQATKLTTTNLRDDMLAIAREWGIPLDSLDFDLLSYKTFYKGIIDDAWRLLDAQNLDEITTEKEIRSATLQIRQEYELIVHPIEKIPGFDLRFSIATDKLKTKAIAIIDPASIIPSNPDAAKLIKEAIIRKKLRTGFLIGITDGNLDEEIIKLLEKIETEGSLSESYRMPIAEFFSPVFPINDGILLHYKKIMRSNNIIDGVEPDDLILEYIIPKKGLDGRSCTGEYIQAGEPIIRFANAISINPENIRSEEDEKSIRYYALKSGFVERRGGVFDISNQLRLSSAGFKETGSIEVGTEKEINILIDQRDEEEDAIGMGINIDVQKLDVKGTIGSNTTITAQEVNIDAQTHKKSQIQVTENAKVHLHRGNLKAKTATIEILETGRVEAENVHVKKMVGGEIIAHNVIVDVLYSNANIIALESIEIKAIAGDGNNLIIDPYSIPSYHDKVIVLEEELKTKIAELHAKKKALHAREIAFKEKKPRIQRDNYAIKQAIAENRSPLKANIIRVQEYKKEETEIHNEHIVLQAYQENITMLEKNLQKIYDADLHARVMCHGNCNGHTQIRFVDPKTHHNYTITPQGKAPLVTLKKEGDQKRIVIES